MATGMDTPERWIAGRYQLRDELGRGGMATVYLAFDHHLQRDVALKLFSTDTATDADFATAFLAEARLAASIHHPNVARVFDAGRHAGRPFIVMEYLAGGDLAALLAARGRLEPAEVVRIGHGVARGLAALHARGLVHCDVKPQNVLLTRDGQPRLVDFGIACAASSTTTPDSDAIRGSVHYLSPEQVRGEPLDPRTDVYALGIVLYELLTGQPPFSGSSLVEVALQRLHSRPRSPRDLVPDVPPTLATSIHGALTLDPAARFPDAAALAASLAGEPAARSAAVVQHGSSADAAPAGLTARLRSLAADRPFKRARTLALALARSLSLTHSPTHQLPRWLLAVLVGLTLFQVGLLGNSSLGSKAAERGEPTRVEALAVAPLAGTNPVPAAARLPATTPPRQAEPTLVPPTPVPPTPVPSTSRPPRSTVPAVDVPEVGALALEDAANTLRAAGLEVAVVEQVTLDTSSGVVVAHEPPAGTSVPRGETVTLLVSSGVEIPGLVGQHWDDVAPWLEQHGWRPRRVRFVVASVDQWGLVVAQSPAPEAGAVPDKQGTLYLEVAGPPSATRTGLTIAAR